MLVGAIHTITKAPLSERTAPAYEQPDDNTSGALDRLGNLTEAAAHSRKAFAEERLKQLREQMNKLMLFDMAPSVQAGRSAQFARKLKAAAEDFAGAFEALAAPAQAARQWSVAGSTGLPRSRRRPATGSTVPHPGRYRDDGQLHERRAAANSHGRKRQFTDRSQGQRIRPGGRSLRHRIGGDRDDGSPQERLSAQGILLVDGSKAAGFLPCAKPESDIALKQPASRCACLVCYVFAGQHPRDFLAPRIRAHGGDPCRHGLRARFARSLGDQQMRGGPCGDLRRMGNREHLGRRPTAA
jgi:hypothetical protein